jgi:hypothetical protein
MHRIVTNNFRQRYNGNGNKFPKSNTGSIVESGKYVPQNAKFLAWGIFLFFFIENGTLGLLPRQFYFVYRNMRISDFILYFLIFYSFYCSSEYIELLKNKALIIVYILLIYLIFQFLISAITYNQNFIEYFFRLKAVWASFLIFPFLLLLKRNGLEYLVKLIFPVAIVSNIFYILSAITGITFLPDTVVYKQGLPGGLEIYRVYGGTFYGDLYFLGFIYWGIAKKFKFYQILFIVLFVTPQILALGRNAWVFFSFTILLLIIWNTFQKRDFKTLIRQVFIFGIILVTLGYTFTKILPGSENLLESIQVRALQGQEDVKYQEGSYGERLANNSTLVEYWLQGNIAFGVGMHPFWIINPQTAEEAFLYWGFEDLTWAPVLVAYGLVGFLIYCLFQIYFMYLAFKAAKNSRESDVYTFFILMLLSSLLFASFINFSYILFTLYIFGIPSNISIYIAALIYKCETMMRK